MQTPVTPPAIIMYTFKMADNYSKIMQAHMYSAKLLAFSECFFSHIKLFCHNQVVWACFPKLCHSQQIVQRRLMFRRPVTHSAGVAGLLSDFLPDRPRPIPTIL